MDMFRKTRWETIRDAMLVFIASTIFGFGFSVGTSLFIAAIKLVF